MDKDEIKKYVDSLLYTRTWKNSAVIGVSCLVILVLLNSFLFALLIGLLKLALLVGGVASLCYAAFLAYPDIMKQLKK